MIEQARFCVKCGAGLTEGARFCTGCGEAAVTVTAMEPPAASGERVLGLIPNAVLKSGFLGVGSKPYILVLTDRRVIFAFVTKEMTKKMVADARDDAKADGKGFFGQWGAQMGAYKAFAQRYYEMTPDQTLADAAENFAVERSTIVKTKIVKGTTDDQGTAGPDNLIIKTSDKKKYKLMLMAGTKQARETLIAAAMI